ncbi:MAG: glycosyltransferase [Bacillota bacterium]
MLVRDFVVYCLAAYGLLLVFTMLLDAAKVVRRYPIAVGNRKVLLVLYVRNASGWIEGSMRSLLRCADYWGVPLEVSVVDVGSRDETVEIVKKLARTCQVVKVSQCLLPEELKQRNGSPVIVCDLTGQRASNSGLQEFLDELLSQLCVLSCVSVERFS